MMAQSYFGEIVSAGIGGIVVVVGLLAEHFCDQDWYEYKCLPETRRKSVKYTGEWFVIIGVSIEVIVGIGAAIDAWQNDPLNEPISLISAVVRFNVASDGKMHPSSITNENWGSGIAFFNGTNINQQVFELDAKNSDVDIGNIVGTNGDIVGGGAEYLITFHQNLLLDMPGNGALAMPPDAGIGRPAKSFGEVGSFELLMAQISSNTEVLSGSIFVTINS